VAFFLIEGNRTPELSRELPQAQTRIGGREESPMLVEKITGDNVSGGTLF